MIKVMFTCGDESALPIYWRSQDAPVKVVADARADRSILASNAFLPIGPLDHGAAAADRLVEAVGQSPALGAVPLTTFQDMLSRPMWLVCLGTVQKCVQHSRRVPALRRRRGGARGAGAGVPIRRPAV